MNATPKVFSASNLDRVSPILLGKCGSVLVRLIPAPRGTGIVSAPVPKKLLTMAGIEDCYTSAKGCTGTLGNFGNYSLHL